MATNKSTSKKFAAFADGGVSSPSLERGNRATLGGPNINGRGPAAMPQGDVHPAAYGGGMTLTKRPSTVTTKGNAGPPGVGATTPVSGAGETF